MVLTAGAAVVLTLGLLSIFHSASASSSVARTVTVQVGTVSSSVSASGNVSPAESDSVNFQTGGTLTAVDVAVGDKVKAGQVVAKIDPTDADDALQSAQDSLQVAEMALAEAEAGGTSAQLEQNQASMTNSQLQLTTDEQQLSTDQTTLAQAEADLSSDQALGCPPATSSQSSSSGSSGSHRILGQRPVGGQHERRIRHSSPRTSSLTPRPRRRGEHRAGCNDRVCERRRHHDGDSRCDGRSGWPYDLLLVRVRPDRCLRAPDRLGIGLGIVLETVTAQVSGLTPDTSYIFRVVATNSLGSSTGLGVTFTTAQSSCVAEQQAITTDTQTVQHDEGQITAQEQSIAGTGDGGRPCLFDDPPGREPGPPGQGDGHLRPEGGEQRRL